MNADFDIPDSLFDPPTENLPSPVADTAPGPSGITTESEPWPSRLPFDIALGVDGVEELELRYGLTDIQLQYLLTNPLFLRSVQNHRDEISVNGVGFKHKARVQAETYLSELDEIVTNKSNSPAVRLDAIKSVVKYAGLSGEDGKAQGPGGQSTKLIIQWADGSSQMAVEMRNGLTPDTE